MNLKPNEIAAHVKMVRTKIGHVLDDRAIADADLQALAGQLSLFADLGFPVETCEIIDILEDRLDEDSSEGRRVACMKMHMNISRRKNMNAVREFSQKLKQMHETEWQAHGNFADGMLKVLDGDFDSARLMFEASRKQFLDAGLEVYAAKLLVAIIMTLRAQNRNADAFALIQQHLPDTETLGIAAISPLVILYATAASHCLDEKQNYRARSYSWLAVRLTTALPGSKSAGYVAFQHGRIEQELGCSKKAVIYLLKAEEIQNILDPVARIATRIHQMRAWRHLKNWRACEEVLNQLWDDPVVSLNPTDFGELFKESLQYYLDIHDATAAASLINRLSSVNLISPETVGRLKKTASDRISTYLKRWEQAQILQKKSSTRDFIKIDFQSGIARGVDEKGAIRGLEFRSRSSVSALLKMLVSLERGTTLQDCLEHLLNSWNGKRSTADRSLKKTLLRGISTLVDAGIAESRVLHDKTMIYFRPGVRILILN